MINLHKKATMNISRQCTKHNNHQKKWPHDRTLIELYCYVVCRRQYKYVPIVVQNSNQKERNKILPVIFFCMLAQTFLFLLDSIFMIILIAIVILVSGRSLIISDDFQWWLHFRLRSTIILWHVAYKITLPFIKLCPVIYFEYSKLCF